MSKFHRLVRWLQGDSSKCIPKSFISPKLKVMDDPEMGRSILANNIINKHEDIITIPHTFLMNYVTVLIHIASFNLDFKLDWMSTNIYVPSADPTDEDDIYSTLYRRFQITDILQLTSFQLLSMYLVLEKLRRNKSFWKPFIDVLPENDEFKAIPFTWLIKDPTSKSFELLPESIKSHSLKQLDNFNRDYNIVTNLLSSYSIPEPITKSDFLWSWLCCNSRCLYMTLPPELNLANESNFTLVPFVDFLNHELDDHCGIEILQSKGFKVNTQTSKYATDEQLYFSYGSHSDEFLICEYGFMFKKGVNTQNSIDLTPYIEPLLKPKHVRFLEDENYYGDYTATKNELSFRTEIVLAVLQEPEMNLSNEDGDGDGCPKRLRAFMNGMTSGETYQKNSKLLTVRIMNKIMKRCNQKLLELNDSQVESNQAAEAGVIKRCYENILDIATVYT